MIIHAKRAFTVISFHKLGVSGRFFYLYRKHSVARSHYMRLDTSGTETMQCTFQDNASDDEDSPPPSQISGGRGNSPPLPVREGLKRVEYMSFERVWTFYATCNEATISHISWWDRLVLHFIIGSI